MGWRFLHEHTCYSSPVTLHSLVLLAQSLLAGLIPSRALRGRQVQASVSTLCHLCHLQPQTHFTASLIWCQQLQTVSLGPAVSDKSEQSALSVAIVFSLYWAEKGHRFEAQKEIAFLRT